MKLLLTLLLAIPFTLCAQNDPLWMRYSAISPDGNEIAFSYKGDLYKVNAKGGQALQLTNHQAHDTEPVWSNDGRSIAFASDRYGNFDIHLISASGGESKRLTYHSAGDHPTDFSPDGSKVIYYSSRMDEQQAVFFPSGALPEVYQVGIDGGKEVQLMSTPAQMAQYNPAGTKLIFHNRKGYENEWRKHHTSSVTRDIMSYDIASKQFSNNITWDGEDRNPVWKNDTEFYYLSEKSGSFNIWKSDINGGIPIQITQYDTHPVRFLSITTSGTLCYGFDGEIYKLDEGSTAEKVNIQIKTDDQYNDILIEKITSGATEFSVSSNGKEVAFIAHGEVFVTSIEYGATKRITDTPEQERNLHFNPEGNALIYSGERNGSWNIYQATLGREEDKYFYNATTIKEEALIATTAEEFQPAFSPDGKEIAYLEERTTVKVFNIASKQSRTVLDGALNYSYADGDQYFKWSPDSKWLLVDYFDNDRWNTDVGLLNVSSKEMINLTNSGYFNGGGKFAMDGEMVYWNSTKNGFRSHGSWGSQSDVYAIFLTNNAYNKFTLSKGDYELWKEEQDDSKEEDTDEDDGKKKKKKDDDQEQRAETKSLVIEKEGLDDRKVRLTINSSFLGDYLVDNDGENMYYISNYDKGFDLWSTKFKDRETKVLAKLGTSGSRLEFDKDQKNIFYVNRGRLNKVGTSDGKNKGISFSSEMNLNKSAQRTYMFNHVWRQFKKKFYLEDLHNVDWDMYKTAYAKFLPHINNGHDFAEMLSEMLGEVNASHTGSGYFGRILTNGDQTGAFGAFYDESYTGNGLKISEIIGKSPLITKTKKIKAGVVIEKINGNAITSNTNQYQLLNRKVGEKLLISFYDATNGNRWDEVIKPISLGAQNNLLYERWIESREAEVDRISKGTVGYVHVRGMNSASFREVYEKVLGKHNSKKALIVDTRFNGGGWLHDDLATFLDGKRYMSFEPRGQKNMGGEPLAKWQKASCVLMSESNYSDAHMFPYTYKALGIGKLVGMPVPGTGTAVWWETLLDSETYFGIPQIGMRTEDGKLMENTQLDPDVKVDNEWNEVIKGRDQQLEAAVKLMMEE
jgi:Tol biopolymer transport system component/C-terminal processing protease CtpA/Prc